jgi:hypothetical protein
MFSTTEKALPYVRHNHQQTLLPDLSCVPEVVSCRTTCTFGHALATILSLPKSGSCSVKTSVFKDTWIWRRYSVALHLRTDSAPSSPSFTGGSLPTPPPVGHLVLVSYFGVLSSSPGMDAACCRKVSGVFFLLNDSYSWSLTIFH